MQDPLGLGLPNPDSFCVTRSCGFGKWDARIHSLNVEKEALQQALEAVQSDLALATCARVRLENATIPILRFPEVLLADVFRHVYSTCDGPEMEDRLLLSITSTCFHFRSVAIRASFLWSNIVLRPGDISPKMRSYIERSGTAPLRLTLVVDNSFNRWSSGRMKGWIDSLAPYLTRCHRFTLSTTGHDVANTILPLRTPMPDLREFIWDASDAFQHDDVTDQRPIILLDHPVSLPNTYSVAIRDKSLPINWERSVAHIRHLSLIDLAGIPNLTVVELVAQCPELKSLRWLRYLSDDPLYTTSMPAFTSPSLEVLDMDLPDVGDPSNSLLTRMDFPRLRHLVLSAYVTNTRWADRAVDSMPRFPCLHTVWISSWAFSPEAAIEYLTAHPTVEEFGCGVTPSIGALISLLNEPTCFVPWTFRLPKLRYIYLLDAPHSFNIVVGVANGLRALMRGRGVGPGNEFKLKIQLNDKLWTNVTTIPNEYEELASDFPRNVTLSSSEDTPPSRFRSSQWE